VDFLGNQEYPFNERIKSSSSGDVLTCSTELISPPDPDQWAAVARQTGLQRIRFNVPQAWLWPVRDHGDFNGDSGIGPGEAFNMQLAAKIIF